jgi:hypothetical protein
VKQFAKFVVDLADSVAPTDIEEGMRVGWVPQLALTTLKKKKTKTTLCGLSPQTNYTDRAIAACQRS